MPICRHKWKPGAPVQKHRRPKPAAAPRKDEGDGTSNLPSFGNMQPDPVKHASRGPTTSPNAPVSWDAIVRTAALKRSLAKIKTPGAMRVLDSLFGGGAAGRSTGGAAKEQAAGLAHPGTTRTHHAQPVSAAAAAVAAASVSAAAAVPAMAAGLQTLPTVAEVASAMSSTSQLPPQGPQSSCQAPNVLLPPADALPGSIIDPNRQRLGMLIHASQTTGTGSPTEKSATPLVSSNNEVSSSSMIQLMGPALAKSRWQMIAAIVWSRQLKALTGEVGLERFCAWAGMWGLNL